MPDRARVIDLRPRHAYESWHYPDSLHLDYKLALDAFPSFARDHAYVLVCDYGIVSAHLAETMRGTGLRATTSAGARRRCVVMRRNAVSWRRTRRRAAS